MFFKEKNHLLENMSSAHLRVFQKILGAIFLVQENVLRCQADF